MTTTAGERRSGDEAMPAPRVVSVGQSIRLSEGEVVPVALTLEAGPTLRMSVPLGGFTVRQGRPCFVPTVDVVGLTAVVLSLRLAGRGVKNLRPLIDALAAKLQKRR